MVKSPEDYPHLVDILPYRASLAPQYPDFAIGTKEVLNGSV